MIAPKRDLRVIEEDGMKTMLLVGVLGGICVVSIPSLAATRNGDLDPNFGDAGLTIVDIGTGSGAWVDMAVDALGRIVLAGSTDRGPPTGNDFVVARLNPDGSPDTGFDFDGQVDIVVGPDDSDDQVFSVIVQADGKIVVAGSAQSPTAGNQMDMAFVRLLANGALDTTFGAGGKAFIDFGLGGPGGSFDTVRKVVQLPDGKLIGAGQTSVAGESDDFAIVKLNIDGSRDTTFGTGGRVTVRFSLSDEFRRDQAATVGVDSAGRIVVAGLTTKTSDFDSDFAVARLLANGQLDPAFSGDGRATVAFDLAGDLSDGAYGLHIDPDDYIVLVGTAMDVGGDIAVARLRPDGSLDSGFGVGGKVTVPFDLGGLNSEFGVAVTRHGGGRYFITGLAMSATGLVAPLVQLLADGQLDPGFGVAGKAYLENPFGGNQMVFTSAVLSNHRMIIGGLASPPDTVASLVAGAVLVDVLFADDYESD